MSRSDPVTRTAVGGFATGRLLRIAPPTPWIPPSLRSGGAYGIRRQSATELNLLVASHQPDLAVPRQSIRESHRLFSSSKY
jgi:hypothetical protein